jgi:hypothetical protein
MSHYPWFMNTEHVKKPAYGGQAGPKEAPRKQICVTIGEDVIEWVREMKEKLQEAGYRGAREGTAVDLALRYIIENKLEETWLTWTRGRLAEGQ